MSEFPAIIWGTRSISRQKLDQYVGAVIKLLKGRGIGVGDRLVLVDQTSVEYVIVLIALWRMGAVACPLNPHWPYETISQAVSSLNPKAIISNVQQVNSKKISVPVLQFNDLIAYDVRQSEPVAAAEIPLNQEATIIWTSGSNGQPKAVVHTWGNHVYSAKGSQEMIPLKAGDRWLLSLPLYHVSGISIVVRCLLAGATVVVSRDEGLAQTILKTKPTHLSLVTTQLYRFLSFPNVSIGNPESGPPINTFGGDIPYSFKRPLRSLIILSIFLVSALS